LLNFHPHIHAIALSGSIDGQETFHPLEPDKSAELAAAFADYLFRALLTEALIDQQTVDEAE